MPEIAVRGAGPLDLARIAELEAASFSHPWPEAELVRELAHPATLLLVARAGDGPIAGYALFHQAAGEAELLRLGVAPGERGRGTGRMLVEAGLRRLADRGTTLCHLEVRVDNEPALALYRRLGFRPVGVRSGYYRDGTDALVFSRSLP